MGNANLRGLSNRELLRRLDDLANKERGLGAVIVAHLVEVERRGVHLEYGYSSLYTYCVERLGFTKDMAYRRMQAARAAAKHPEVLGHLQSGELSLSTVRTIAPHLATKGAELIQAAVGKSDREVKRLVAELVAQPVAAAATMTPVAGGKVRLEVVVDADVAKAIEKAVALDRHIDPSGDLGALLERMTQGYLKRRMKERFAVSEEAAATKRRSPRRTRKGKGRRTVMAESRRELVRRDGTQCAWIGPDGRRCTETGFLEIDHVHSVALGGRGESAAELRLLCRAHNQFSAEQTYGSAYMERKRPTATRRDLILAMQRTGFSKAVASRSVDRALEKRDASDSLEALLRRCFQQAGES